MNLQIKLIILGNQYVGKTTLLKRLIHDTFREFYMATIGVDYDRIEYNYKNNDHEIILWDTSGQDKFNFLLNSYFSSVNGAFIMCDINNEESFIQAKKWIEELRIRKKNDNIPILFIANKIDYKTRCVSSNDIQKVGKEYNVKTIEISLKTTENIEQIFPMIIDDYFEKLANNKISLENDNIRTFKKDINSFKILENNEPRPRCCNIL